MLEIKNNSQEDLNQESNNISASITIKKRLSKYEILVGKLTFYKEKDYDIKFRLLNKPNYEFSGKIIFIIDHFPIITDGYLQIMCKNNKEMLFSLSEIDIDTIMPIEINPIIDYIRPNIPESIRKDIFNRDSNLCQYKLDGCTLDKDLQIDHIMPISLGGTSNKENLVTSCGNCNKKKGNKVIF